MLRSRRGDDGGAILILVLVVVMVLGLILSAMFGNAGANERSTPFIKAHLESVYAADAGIEAAIQRLRQDSNFCGQRRVVSPPTIQTVRYDDLTSGHDVAVTCQVLSNSGASIGAGGYAAIIRDTGDQALNLTQGSAEKLITGPVFLSGGIDVSGNHDLTINSGDIDLPCSNTRDLATSLAASVNFDTGFGFRTCQDAQEVDHDLPPEPCTAAPALTFPGACTPSYKGYTRSGVSNCRIFLPGRYTTAPELLQGGTNYFASGVYNFAFNSRLDIQGASGTETEVVGGGIGATSGCEKDPAGTEVLVPVELGATLPSYKLVTDKGATFVFSGTSYIKMGSKGKITIRPRITTTSETQKLSVVALPSNNDGQDDTSWNTYISTISSSSGVSTTVLDPTSGSTTTEYIGGVYYTPAANLTVDATNGTETKFLGGIVVNDLTIGETPSADFLEVSISGDATTRKVLLTSSATPTDTTDATYGGEAVTSAAVVAVSASRSISGFPTIVQSWRSSAP